MKPRRRKVQRPPIDPDARRYYIYRLYDATGALLYIGRSCRPLQRLKGHHASGADWPKAVVQIDAEGVYAWDEAVQRERQAILSERPRHNIDGVTKKTGRLARFEAAS